MKALLAILGEKRTPREHRESLLSEFTVEEAKMLEIITHADEAQFLSASRTASLARLILVHKRQAVQRSITSMKQQVQLAAARAPETVPELLQQIMLLSGTLTSIERQITS